MSGHDPDFALSRWRLVLGRFAEGAMPDVLQGQAGRMDAVLEYIYGREYGGRGARPRGQGGEGEPRGAGLEPSQLSLPTWIREVRELFPQETVEIVERHALARYEMTELVTDPELLGRMEPSYELLKAILTFKGMMRGRALDMARELVRRVVEDMRRKLEGSVRRALWGRRNRFSHSPLRAASNFDWRRTVRANLRHYDPVRRRLILEKLCFFSRVERHLPWHVIIAVDQSGSMIDSVIHGAVMAGILSGMPSLKVSLVAFDTEVADLTGYADDPTEALMSVQLGGGTDIAQALAYCQGLVEVPHRTVLLVVTDFYEGGAAERLMQQVHRVLEGGVRLLGLAALDAKATPAYDREMAQGWVDAGAEVAALTPLQLSEWLTGVIRT